MLHLECKSHKRNLKFYGETKHWPLSTGIITEKIILSVHK